jgi:hypothetical protein
MISAPISALIKIKTIVMKIAVATTRNFNNQSVMKELSASNTCCSPKKKW